MEKNIKSLYTPFFCEENIWQVLNSIPARNHNKYKVLFLINQEKSIALVNQQAAPRNEVIIWDYHVILVDIESLEIFDFDSRLNFPEDLENYFLNTFWEQNQFPENFRTFCRVIPAGLYLKRFYSDRSHMLDSAGNELKPFPEWPAISGKPALKLSDLLDHQKVLDYPLIPIYDFLNDIKDNN